jgi:hypothetical protein
VNEKLKTALLFLAVFAGTLAVFMGGWYALDAIQQRNQAGELAIQILQDVQQQRRPAPVQQQQPGQAPSNPSN